MLARRTQLIQQARSIRSKSWTICKETDNSLKHTERNLCDQRFRADEHFDYEISECLLNDIREERIRCHRASVALIAGFDRSIDLMESGLLTTEELEKTLFQMAMKARNLAK